MSVNQDKKTKKWYFRCYYRDSFGETKPKYQTGFDTKRLALNAEAEFLKSIHTVIRNITFKELATIYLEHQSKRIGISAYLDYKRTLLGICEPYWKNMPLHTLTVKKIYAWQDYLLSLKHNGKPYANSYIDKIQTTFNAVIKFGTLQGYLEHNMTFGVKNVTRPGEFKKEIQYFTFDEFNSFINVVNDQLHYNLFSLLYWCGPRIGEAIALTWNDIDLNNGTIRINKTYNAKSRSVTPPKTRQSYRTIYLSNNLKRSLEAFYESEKDRVEFNDSCIVFGFNKFLDDNTIKRAKDSYCIAANVKTIRIHDFRHSHVSLLINSGCTPFEISRRLGHSISMVESTYSHMFASTQQNIVNLLNKYEENM